MRHRHRLINATVIDDQCLDHVNAIDVARQISQHDGQCICFIETGYLDDELHGAIVARRSGAGQVVWRGS